MRSRDQAIAVTGCCLALATLLPVALYQSELIDHLPDPPGDVFDSDKITSSKMAHPLGMPDSYAGLASYGATLALVLLSGKSRSAERLLGAKLLGDAGLAGFNVVRQVGSFGKLCGWCTGTALATALVVYGGRKPLAATIKAVQQAL